MRIKCARGPMANKYMEIDEKGMWSDRLEIAGPVELDKDWYNGGYAPFMPMEQRRGHYQRSNEVLKNGAVVYQWMGWRQ